MGGLQHAHAHCYRGYSLLSGKKKTLNVNNGMDK